MAEFRATLRVVKSYLQYSGFRVEDMSAEWDGHRLLGWCEHYLAYEICPHGPEVAVQHLMTTLEGKIGQPPCVPSHRWTRADSNAVLVANGFKPLP
tara:strand:+ start:3534 stop:3821 length:288 start_codon:yes stop_codon:yes gene_type:complete